MNETWRLFVALALPGEVKTALAALRAELEPVLPSLRWVRPQGIHLTLKFFGDLPVERLDDVRGALSRCLADEAGEPSRLETAGVGVFPNLRAPRVLWVGFHQVPERVYHLQRRVEEAAEGLGIPREERAFRPHLTLGRFRRQLRQAERERLSSFLSRDAGRTFGGLVVSRLSLFRSILSPGGARYEEVDGWTLAPGVRREDDGSPDEVTEQC